VAGDWIKFEKTTLTKPEILLLADRLGIHRLHAVGLCLSFWAWCDDQLGSCHAKSVTESMIDSVVGVTGFASALLEIGWLRSRNGSVEVPNLDRHISESAKNRALSGKRKAKSRHGNVTGVSRSERDKSVTREEKRREEVKTEEPPNPPAGGDGSPQSPPDVTAKPQAPAMPAKSPRQPRKTTVAVEQVEIPDVLRSPEFERAWADWIRFRIEKKQPLTPSTIKRQYAQLAGYGLRGAIDSIDRSITKGWMGLFPPEQTQSGARYPPRFQTQQEQILAQVLDAAQDDDPNTEGSLF
jgi:hypothetical protein